MTPEQLKTSILQYAIQGKLVEQRPEEGTADELFRSIQEEIQRFVNEKKIGKPKRVLPISDIEPPYEVPDNWKWVRLGLVCNEILVPQRDKPKCFDGDIPWCRIEDIDGKYLNGTKSNQFVSEQTVSSMNLKVNPIGTVISANSASVGEAAICTVRCITNQTFIGLVCNDGVYNEFLYYFLIANKGNIRKLGAGTTILYISQDKYWNMPFPLPPLEEQHRIVAKIEELLPYVDRYAEAYEKLEQFNAKFPEDMKKSILQYAIQGKLVEQRLEEGTAEELYQQIQEDRELRIKRGEIKRDKRASLEGLEVEKPFDIPDSWKWVTLGSVLLKLTDGTHKTPKYTECGIKFVSVKDMSSGFLSLENTKYISPEEHKELYLRCDPQKGDMLLSKVGTTGVPAIIDTDEEFSLFVSVALLKYNHDYINEKFLYYLLQSPLVQIQATENTRGVGNKNWVLDAIGKTLIVLPPYQEQCRIVSELDGLLPYCDRLLAGGQ